LNLSKKIPLKGVFEGTKTKNILNLSKKTKGCQIFNPPEDKSIRLRGGSILKDAIAQDDLSFLHI